MRKFLIIALVGVALMSCNVTRTVTTQSQYYQRGDTTCTIVTKTIESYLLTLTKLKENYGKSKMG